MSVGANRQIFVSHDGKEKQEIKTLLQPIRYLPFELYIAIDHRQPGFIMNQIENNLKESIIIIPFITENSVDNRWVNQEVGFARAKNMTIIPVFEKSDLLSGFLSGVKGVPLSDDNTRTTYEIVSFLRNEFAPLDWRGPDWCLEFLCPNCSSFQICPIVESQKQLWEKYTNGENYILNCPGCDTTHQFNPASLQYLG